MTSPKISPSKKSVWKWWYTNCAVQQVYLVLSVIGGILLTIYAIMLGTLQLHQTGYAKNDLAIKLFNKYKAEIITYLVLSFVIAFVVNNLILVQYCNLGMKGGKNVLFSLLLFFLVLPAVSSLISYIMSMILLRKLIAEIKEIKN